jgi:hypothetical protein
LFAVSEKFNLSRGEVQNLMNSAASFASSVLLFCKEIEEFWAYQVQVTVVLHLAERSVQNRRLGGLPGTGTE